MFRTNCIIYIMFIMSFPGIFLSISNYSFDRVPRDGMDLPSHRSIPTSFPRTPSPLKTHPPCSHKMVSETTVPELANWQSQQENGSWIWLNSWLGLNRNHRLWRDLLGWWGYLRIYTTCQLLFPRLFRLTSRWMIGGVCVCKYSRPLAISSMRPS